MVIAEWICTGIGWLFYVEILICFLNLKKIIVCFVFCMNFSYNLFLCGFFYTQYLVVLTLVRYYRNR